MAKRGRKPLMRVEGTCGEDKGYHGSGNSKFVMTITRDGMAGYGYCPDGHWNIKFLKPADELMYLYLTKHKLTGGSLSGIEKKLLYAAFFKWAEAKKIEIASSYRRGGRMQVTLPPKISFIDEKILFPDFSRAFDYPTTEHQFKFRDAQMIQDLQRIASAYQTLFRAQSFSIDTIEDLKGGISRIKDYIGMETANKDDVIKEFNLRILAHNEKIMSQLREYAKQHYGV